MNIGENSVMAGSSTLLLFLLGENMSDKPSDKLEKLVKTITLKRHAEEGSRILLEEILWVVDRKSHRARSQVINMINNNRS